MAPSTDGVPRGSERLLQAPGARSAQPSQYGLRKNPGMAPLCHRFSRVPARSRAARPGAALSATWKSPLRFQRSMDYFGLKADRKMRRARPKSHSRRRSEWITRPVFDRNYQLRLLRAPTDHSRLKSLLPIGSLSRGGPHFTVSNPSLGYLQGEDHSSSAGCEMGKTYTESRIDRSL
jgi:hypothetical protein